jgi:soluble lytic murein transglycosylase
VKEPRSNIVNPFKTSQQGCFHSEPLRNWQKNWHAGSVLQLLAWLTEPSSLNGIVIATLFVWGGLMIRYTLAFCLAGALGTALAQAKEPLSSEPLTTGSIARPQVSSVSVTRDQADLLLLKAAITAYKSGQIEEGDRIARTLSAPVARLAAEWSALRAAPRNLGFARIEAFLADAHDLPMRGWLRRKAEDALFLERAKSLGEGRGSRVVAFFGSEPPQAPTGRAMYAAALATVGETARAEALALEAYLDRMANRDVAGFVEVQFPAVITPGVKEQRAHRLILADRTAEGLRLAGELGPAKLKLAQLLAHANDDGKASGPLDNVPPELRSHPAYRLAAAQILRRQDKWEAARDALLAVSRETQVSVDGDAFWTERRTLARRLLNMGDSAGAYRVVAEHRGASEGHSAEAEFHAGWIALRYLHYPQTAAQHFDESARRALTPLAKARAAYWQGRAVRAGADGDANAFFVQAARYPATYYGQLSAAELTHAALVWPPVPHAEPPDTRATALIRALKTADAADLALPLAIDLARTTGRDGEIEAAAKLFEQSGDAGAVLAIGKAALERDRPFVHRAFPTFGVPPFVLLPGSAEPAIVYAITRQESAFRTKAVSHAGAKGLMQMLPSTAARTAQRFGVAFDGGRLTNDGAYNARLGAAHVGELMAETRGSLVMAIASYNAGGHRAREWAAAFGDPRDPATDVIDWIERIPFYETRHYVQKVLENLQVYRARFGGPETPLRLMDDLATGRRSPVSASVLGVEER